MTTEHCDRCNIAREELSEEGILVCPTCGSEENMLVVSDYPSFRDTPKERNNYAYKKINHLISSTYSQIKSDDLPKRTLDLLMDEKPSFLNIIACHFSS